MIWKLTVPQSKVYSCEYINISNINTDNMTEFVWIDELTDIKKNMVRRINEKGQSSSKLLFPLVHHPFNTSLFYIDYQYKICKSTFYSNSSGSCVALYQTLTNDIHDIIVYHQQNYLNLILLLNLENFLLKLRKQNVSNKHTISYFSSTLFTTTRVFNQ